MNPSTPSPRTPAHPADRHQGVTVRPQVEPSLIHYEGAKEPTVSLWGLVGTILFILVLAWLLYHFTALR